MIEKLHAPLIVDHNPAIIARCAAKDDRPLVTEIMLVPMAAFMSMPP